MLTVTDLSKAYGAQTLFDGVSFQVGPGERVGLVGRNGSGKSTLFRILLGEEAPDGGRVTVPAGYRLGHLSQHLHFAQGTVLDEAASALPRREDGADETYRAKAVLSGLGFGEADLSRRPSDLSGGFQVRLNLARVLLSDANLLLLDEPTNYLDIVSIRWLGRFLRAWRGGLLLITHDRDFMDSVTTHTMAIHRRRVRKMAGGTEKLSRQILQEEEVHERTRINDERERQEAEVFIARFRAQATKARAVQSRIKALARRERLDKLEEIGDLDFRFSEAPFAGKRLLEARDLCFGYDAGRTLIEGLSLSVGPGDRIAVVGPNGRGKTTLLRLLAGELPPSSGAVRPALNLKIGYFGQTNVDRLRAELTVEEEIRQANPALTRTRVRTLCGAMMFEGDAAEKRIAVLSGGERSRVLLGKILAAPVNLLLLDEPTNHLDQESVDAFLDAVSAFDGGVVIVTHIERVLSALATKLVVFDRDKVALFHGGYADFLERVGWQAEAREDSVSGAARERRVHGRTNAAARPGWPSVAEVRTTESDEATDGRERPGARRELRRQRAEIVTRRSRELGELRRNIDAAEAEILALEARLAGDEAAIVDAAVRNDGAAVRALSASASAARARIEALFAGMAALEEELRRRERFYDAELGDEGG